MTIVEKAAYLKGLTAGLGVDAESRDGKLWAALCELVTDMAHEIEDLQQSNMDFAEALDDISVDLTYLEELTCDLDKAEDFENYDEEDGFECSGSCSSCSGGCEFGYPDDDEDLNVDEESTAFYDENSLQDGDEEIEYDGVMYELVCPKCGSELTIDEDTLAEGSTTCPDCGEILEFDLDTED